MSGRKIMPPRAYKKMEKSYAIKKEIKSGKNTRKNSE